MPNPPVRVLIVEDNPADATLLVHELKSGGLQFESVRVETEAAYLAALATERDVVLCDWNLPQFDSLRALTLLRERWPNTPFILVSGSIGEEAAVHIIKHGATDYLLKDRLVRLVPSVKQALMNRALQISAQQALAALKESEARYRLLFESNPHPMWVYDLETLRFLAVNETAVNHYGYSRDEFLAMTIRDIRPAEDIPRLQATVSDLDADPTAATHWRHRKKDGTVFDVEVSSNDYSEGGRPARLVLALDVTERNRAAAEVRRTGELLRAIVDGTTDAVFIKDRAGKYLLFNGAAAKFVGKPVEAVLGRDDTELFGPADAAAIMANDARVVASGLVETNEETLTAAGATRTYLATKGPYRDAAGTVIGVLGISRDITERKLAEQERRRLAEQYSDLFERAAIGIFRSAPAGRYLVLNPTFARIFGYESAAAMIAAVTDIGTQVYAEPDQRDEYLGLLTASDAMVEFECECRRRDGARIWVRQNTRAVRDACGTVLYLEGFVQDVTERKRVEAELLLRDRAMRAVTQGIVISDARQTDRPILYVSPGFERMTGYAAGDVVGKNCRFLQGKETDPGAVSQIRAALRGARPAAVEIRNYRKDGTPFWNELSLSPVVDAAGRLTHWVGVQTEVTARRSLEEQLRQSQKMEAVGLLAGGLAHDFNNLLTIINGYSELLVEKLAPGDRRRDSLAAILDAGERAAALTSQLLAFSRKAIVEPKVLDLNRVAESVAKMLRRLIGEDIRFTFDAGPGLARIKMDPGQLEQVIMNLAVNARDAMPRGGTLTVATANVKLPAAAQTDSGECPPGDFVQLTVADTGTGMTDDVRRRVFEPFFTTKGVGKGTGLGLATVYGIVRQAGGAVSIDSVLDKGTTIRVLFPAVPGSEAEEGAGKDRVAQTGSETILLVEDEKGVRRLARMGLELQGYTVVEADSGATAIAAAAAHPGPIHMVVTDMVMPEMGGREVAEALRAARPEIKVLYMSGYLDDPVARHGIEMSANSFMQKPFTPLSLARKVREILDSPTAGMSRH